jgi:hypothetical protein
MADPSAPPAEASNQIEPQLSVERIEAFSDEDLQALCEATHAAIIEGGGFGWVRPPERRALEAYFRGLLLVPERQVFVARLNGTIVGSAQLVRPPRNNEAQAFGAHLMHAFIAPYARGHGLATLLTLRVEEAARAMKFQVLNLDVRETQQAAIRLYETLGYLCWGEHPMYARVHGKPVRGLFYYKLLQPTGA